MPFLLPCFQDLQESSKDTQCTAPASEQPDHNVGDLGALLAQILNIDPLELERSQEEEAMKKYFEEKKKLVGTILYVIDSDGDFTMIFNCASEPEMQLVLSVKIADKNNLSWPEVRAIVQCFTLGDRGSAMSVATFKSLEKKLKEKVGKVWLQQNESQSNHIILMIRPSKSENAFSAGKITKSYFEKDADGDYAVHFESEVDQFLIVVKNIGKYKPYGKLEANALKDAISLS